MRLIADDHSELRYSPPTTFRDALNLDFTTPSARDGVELLSLDAAAHPHGLSLAPTTGDPMIAFPEPLAAFNRVSVELQSAHPGVVEVFWTEVDQGFTAELSERLEITPGGELVEYVFDLSQELNPSRRYQLRIDPIDSRSPVVLRRIEIGLSEQVPSSPVACKVRLGDETREALAVASGETASRRLEVPPRAELSFGLGRYRGGPDELAFTVWFRGLDGERTVLHEERLPVEGEDAAGGHWVDRSVSLRGLAGRRGWIEASTSTSAPGADTVGPVFWANPTVYGGAADEDRPNLLLVSLDTLGAGHLSAYGAEGIEDELLSRLAEEGVLFESSFSSSSLTHVSHAAMLTGTPPLDGNLFWLRGGRLAGVTLAEELRRHGYRTAAFTGGILVTEQGGFDLGFETFRQADSLYEPPLARTDVQQVLDRGEEWLVHRAAPWFLFLHSYEVHSPYYFQSEPLDEEPPEPEDFYDVVHMKGLAPVDLSRAGRYLATLGPEGEERTRQGEVVTPQDIQRLREAHASEIARVDDALERFLARLRRRGLLENTVVVVTADHGEAFFEHNLFEHGLLYDENLRVPLIVLAPGRVPGGRRVAEPVNAVDLMPTLLDLLGVAPQEELAGRSLVEAMEGRGLAPTPFYAFVPGNGLALDDGTGNKLIWRIALMQESFGRHELFDRVSDPGERRDLLAGGGPTADRLEQAARRVVERLPGVHVDLRGFAGERCRLALAGAEVGVDAVYAVGLAVEERQADPYSPGQPWRATIRLGERPRLIVMGTGGEAPVSLDLGCVPGGGTDRFMLRPDALGLAPATVVGADGAGAIEAWRVEPREKELSGELSPEDRERLRSLGYL